MSAIRASRFERLEVRKKNSWTTWNLWKRQNDNIQTAKLAAGKEKALRFRFLQVIVFLLSLSLFCLIINFRREKNKSSKKSRSLINAANYLAGRNRRFTLQNLPPWPSTWKPGGIRWIQECPSNPLTMYSNLFDNLALFKHFSNFADFYLSFSVAFCRSHSWF